MPFAVSVIVPVYNEAAVLPTVLRGLSALALDGDHEVIAVDDGSTDGSGAILDAWAQPPDRRVIHLPRNAGKGAALRAGFAAARGEIVVVHDADGEYDVADHAALLAPLLAGRADAVWGNRMHRGNPVGYRRYWLGNYAISLLASVLYGRRVHDVETGAKALRRTLLPRLRLAAERFDVEVELTARVLQARVPFAEVPVRYRPRSFVQGKKISWRDGVRAVGLLVWYRFGGK